MNKKTNVKGASVFIFVAGLFIILLGLHNIDLHHNFTYLSIEEDFSLDGYTEHNILGNPVSLDRLYLEGITMILIGMCVCCIGFFIILSKNQQLS